MATFWRLLTSALTTGMMTRDDRAIPAYRSCNGRGSVGTPRNSLAPASGMHRLFDRRGADEESGDPTSLPDAAKIPQAATSCF